MIFKYIGITYNQIVQNLKSKLDDNVTFNCIIGNESYSPNHEINNGLDINELMQTLIIISCIYQYSENSSPTACTIMTQLL